MRQVCANKGYRAKPKGLSSTSKHGKAVFDRSGINREHQAEVTAFYVSNVEEYIASPQSVWTAYCRNIATLPMNQTSTFIRFGRGGRGSFLGAMMPFTRNCVLQ